MAAPAPCILASASLSFHSPQITVAALSASDAGGCVFWHARES